MANKSGWAMIELAVGEIFMAQLRGSVDTNTEEARTLFRLHMNYEDMNRCASEKDRDGFKSTCIIEESITNALQELGLFPRSTNEEVRRGVQPKQK